MENLQFKCSEVFSVIRYAQTQHNPDIPKISIT